MLKDLLQIFKISSLIKENNFLVKEIYCYKEYCLIKTKNNLFYKIEKDLVRSIKNLKEIDKCFDKKELVLFPFLYDKEINSFSLIKYNVLKKKYPMFFEFLMKENIDLVEFKKLDKILNFNLIKRDKLYLKRFEYLGKEKIEFIKLEREKLYYGGKVFISLKYDILFIKSIMETRKFLTYLSENKKNCLKKGKEDIFSCILKYKV